MRTGDLVRRPGSWLSRGRSGQGGGVAISSRIRLARNVQGAAFPEWAKKEDRVRLCRVLVKAFDGLTSLTGAAVFDMGTVSDIDKDVLRERHLISNELAERGEGSAVVIGDRETISVMVNEEDHLRIQGICPGMGLAALWAKVNAVDSELEARLPYAFSSTLGYLTACPSNVGTGLRASVMLHLPGLGLMNEVEPVIRGLQKLSLAVRGLQGEGTEATGNMYQVSNQATLGESEEAIIERLGRLVEEVVGHERNARARLLEQKRVNLTDHLARAAGILLNARVLPSEEALDLLSAVRLGVETGLLSGITLSRVNEITVLTQPAHLQIMYSRTLKPEERDQVRADLLRDRLKGLRLQE